MCGWKVKGVNDDTDTCELCGKTNLKRVVWMAPLSSDGEEGGVQAIGRCCAAKLLRTTTTQVQRMAEQADANAKEAELRQVHEIGEVRSVCPWVIERIGSNGGTITLLGCANGLRPLVEKWAASRFANCEINVRRAI